MKVLRILLHFLFSIVYLYLSFQKKKNSLDLVSRCSLVCSQFWNWKIVFRVTRLLNSLYLMHSIGAFFLTTVFLYLLLLCYCYAGFKKTKRTTVLKSCISTFFNSHSSFLWIKCLWLTVQLERHMSSRKPLKNQENFITGLFLKQKQWKCKHCQVWTVEKYISWIARS